MSNGSLTRDEQIRITHELAEKIEERYVFPDVARRVAKSLCGGLDGELPGDSADLRAFADRVTQILQRESQDKHLRVSVAESGEREAEERESEDSSKAAEENPREWARLINHAVRRVERLSGNVGYMNLTGFCPLKWGADTVVSAMGFLANASALIIDLRACGGGDLQMVPFLCSYFFDEVTHLNDFYWRPDNSTTQSWTQLHVPGTRLPNTPLFILTSKDTFSAGEDFAYTLQSLKRATIVGETTRGGAHPGQMHEIGNSLEVFIPSGRPTNPITGTNWEGVGVAPDVSVPSDSALDEAHRLALETVARAVDGDRPTAAQRRLADEARKALETLTP